MAAANAGADLVEFNSKLEISGVISLIEALDKEDESLVTRENKKSALLAVLMWVFVEFGVSSWAVVDLSEQNSSFNHEGQSVIHFLCCQMT